MHFIVFLILSILYWILQKKKLVRNLKHWLSKRWTVNYPSFFFLEICFSETCWTSLRFSRCMSASDLIFYSRKNIHKHVKWYNNTFAFMYEYCYQRNQKRKKQSYNVSFLVYINLCYNNNYKIDISDNLFKTIQCLIILFF